ncbi:smoothelin-like protein 1 [Suncus etruscus]|uniref:smoothelin-like protein 1 n=1 Tax=Suncus etruscus TaxID=109475 RepID=UPI0021103557|nr:smoothelin-like protein 1 [Suncus etruscus]
MTDLLDLFPEMEQKEKEPSEDGTTVSSSTEAPGTQGDGPSVQQEAKDSAGGPSKEDSLDGTGSQERTLEEKDPRAALQAEGNGLDAGEATVEAGPPEENDAKEESIAIEAPGDSREEANHEARQAEGKEAPTAHNEKEPEKKAEEEAGRNEEAKAEPESTPEEPEPKAGMQEKAQAATLGDTAQSEEDSKKLKFLSNLEQVPSSPGSFQEPDGPHEEHVQGVEEKSEEGPGGIPSSPEGWPESPTEEGYSFSPDGLSPDTEASAETSPSASESPASDVPQSPKEPPKSQEKKEKAPERRVASAPSRPRGARAQNRKAILDKFGGAASGPTALFRNPKAAGAAVGSVKTMLLEWCRAMTRNYEHVDIQNFSSSWSSGMAFCALIHKFFPDAFDFGALDPAQRRHNFTLAFSTAEKLADCAQLLEVDDMVRLAVPDSKCVYTYIQELYRSLVQKGLVKTKKK